MDFICAACDTELELNDVVSDQPYAGSTEMIETYYYNCPCCGKKYMYNVGYKIFYSDELKEIKDE